MSTYNPRPARRGVAALEFALTIPFLLMVVLGVAELSMLIHRTHLMSRAALDACRTGASIVEGLDPTGDEIEAVAMSEARFALQAGGVDCSEGCVVNADWHNVRDEWMMLTVTVDVPYDGVTGFLPMVPTSTHGEFTMITQQQIID